MRPQNIKSIIRPCDRYLQSDLTIGPEDKISRAIELMVSLNRESIAVVRSSRVIGMVRLEDAYKEIGLPMPSPAGK